MKTLNAQQLCISISLWYFWWISRASRLDIINGSSARMLLQSIGSYIVIYYILHLIELTIAEAMSIPIISLYTRDSGCWLLCIKSSNVPPGMYSTIGNVLANYTLIVYECWNAPDINRVQYSTYDDVIKPWTNTCHAKNKIIIHINLKTFNSIIIIILGLVVLVARIKEECT